MSHFQQIRPIPPLEAAGMSWAVAALVGFGAFAALLILGDWTFLQAAFAGVVLCGALGLLVALTVGRVKPADAHDHRPPTRALATPEPALGVDLDAMRPRDLNAPSPHKTGIDRSMISDTEGYGGLNRSPLGQPIFGTIEAAPATRIPSPAPVNASDEGVARPVGATANPTPMAQPAPLHGRVVTPEPLGGSSAGTVSRNEAAMGAGAPLTVAPTATHSAQSYNEPGAGDDTVVATDATIPESAPASDDASERTAAASDDASRQTEAAPSDAAARSSAAAAPAAARASAVPPEAAEKPTTLDAPRAGKGDDLKMIKGVGPKLEAMLNDMGFWHFDQIAAWTDKEIAWVDHNLEGFKGRVTRDDWVPQARLLASGGETDFSKKVGDGDVY